MAAPSLVLQGGNPPLQGGTGTTITPVQANNNPTSMIGPSAVPDLLNGPNQTQDLHVDPMSTFDGDTMQRYQYATSQGMPQDQAISAATHYQNQKNAANPPDKPGLEGLLTNSDSALNLTNIGSTIGMVGADALGVLLAPETGGLSLIPAIALSSAAAAAGGTLGEGVRSLAGGDNIDYEHAAETSAIAGAGGKLLGLGIKAVAPLASSYLSDQAEKLGLGALGITKGQSAAFGVQTGNKLGDFLTQMGLIGKGADDVTALKDATQEAYDSIARKSGIQVPVSDLTANLEKQVGPLEQGISSDSKEAAQAVRDEYATALKNMGVDINNPNAEVDIGKLTDAKSEYQRQVNWKNPDKINVVKGSLSGTFLQTVNEAADKAGLTDAEGNSLSQIGKKLQGLNLVDQWAQKAANTTGTAKTPWTLGNLIRPAASTVIGTATGGPLGGAIGAGIGIAGDVMANSPKVIGWTAALEKALSSGIPKVVGSPISAVAGDAISQIGGHTVINAANNGSMPSSPSLTDTSTPGQGSVPATPPSSLNPGASNDLATSAIAKLQSGQPMTQNEYQALLEKDLVTTNGRFQDQITKAYNAGQPQAVQGLGVASNAVNTLADLYKSAGGAAGPISGRIESALGSTGLTAKSVKAYNDQKAALGQEIISQIYGSSGTASDRDQVLSLIPDVSDPPEVANSKMSTLRLLIQQRLSSMTGSTPSSVNTLSQGPSLNLQP